MNRIKLFPFPNIRFLVKDSKIDIQHMFRTNCFLFVSTTRMRKQCQVILIIYQIHCAKILVSSTKRSDKYGSVRMIVKMIALLSNERHERMRLRFFVETFFWRVHCFNFTAVSQLTKKFYIHSTLNIQKDALSEMKD